MRERFGGIELESRLCCGGSWDLRFDEPIDLPRGGKLATLGDAGAYITKLPKAEHDATEWQTAMHCLILAAEGRDFLMHARVGMLRALNRNVERVFNPDRKEQYRGKRKLKRDE